MKKITVAEAWRDFAENVIPTLELPGEEMNTVNQARRDEGKKLLGGKRIKGILTTYAPGRYQFIEEVILND